MKLFNRRKKNNQTATGLNTLEDQLSYVQGLKAMRKVVKNVFDGEDEIPFDLYYLVLHKMDEKIAINKEQL
ncbi:hypothetical protein ATX71_09815 [Oenococcus oeni]|uniref:hypothetical protein n=1 Tax=Oenococcus oeni TaxID=1247 RepID=UPI00050FCB38|nr:hypothetical protein [Oenococcus oeni]KGH73711.1 hypothetical protein X280_01945 [Oenococcus oeni IOEB_0502]OIK70400.1 hypothetical protein ATW68_10265 [Oenococcus oeni]OIK73115.1 hypothetical protein ATW68_02435 [Oenococcus oeni]OIK96550.1 hypothetical protein ATW85_09680 [Oenococcus oeni]OIL54775.1 hypothetical protein ATX21_09195 [Oenococcus oeni]